MTFAPGDRIRFAEEKRPYTVRAVSGDGRWLACTKPFAARRTVLYTLVDTAAGLRGVDDSIGNSLGYETRADCEHAIAYISSGAYGFSRRRKPIPLVLVPETDRDKTT